MMRALVATWLVDVPHGESEGLRSALLDVRDALHEVSGRRFEKLDHDHIVDAARFLGREPEEVELQTRNIGRRLAHLAALAWRRVDDVLESRPTTITTSGPVVRRSPTGSDDSTTRSLSCATPITRRPGGRATRRVRGGARRVAARIDHRHPPRRHAR